MKSKLIYLVLILFGLLSGFVLLNYNGTGGSGDSVLHYLYAKYSPAHPELYFNHWAKPLFTLLSSPFAQFGFTGIKIFNAFISLLTVFFTYKTAEKLGVKNAILSALMLIATPLFFALIFSGLTEPLFALFMATSTFYAVKKQYILAGIIISFLPFVRSEGLIIMGVFGLYFIFKQQWKAIPYLIFGHVVYSVSGSFVHQDILWVFTKIPYAAMNDNYGSGNLNHFVTQLMFVVGVPLYILIWFGLVALVWKSIKKTVNLEIRMLVGLAFLTFFIAHSLFWYLGIFNSMGLKRVFLGVAPLMAIIALIGFNFITENLFKNKKTPKLVLQILLVAYVLVFPFTSNPAAPKWNRTLNLSGSQVCALKIAAYFKEHPEHAEKKARFVFIDPYLSMALDIDHFNPAVRAELNSYELEHLKSGDIVIWENWFAVVERGITKKSLDENPDLIFMFDSNVWDNRDIEYGVYLVK
ncbi:MAG: hypothetical protein ACJA0Q_001907 [Saprospiraceae bacterium]|jgi:hypothetical protein